jgi:hypothetical protein
MCFVTRPQRNDRVGAQSAVLPSQCGYANKASHAAAGKRPCRCANRAASGLPGLSKVRLPTRMEASQTRDANMTAMGPDCRACEKSLIHCRRCSPLKYSVAFMVTLAWIVVAGCATAPCRFQVVGTIPSPTTTQLTTSPPLRTVIADALRPFGFRGGEGEHDGLYFYSLGGHGFIPKERIDVRLDADARQIGLIDHNPTRDHAPDGCARLRQSFGEDIFQRFRTRKPNNNRIDS